MFQYNKHNNLEMDPVTLLLCIFLILLIIFYLYYFIQTLNGKGSTYYIIKTDNVDNFDRLSYNINDMEFGGLRYPHQLLRREYQVAHDKDSMSKQSLKNCFEGCESSWLGNEGSQWDCKSNCMREYNHSNF